MPICISKIRCGVVRHRYMIACFLWGIHRGITTGSLEWSVLLRRSIDTVSHVVGSFHIFSRGHCPSGLVTLPSTEVEQRFQAWSHQKAASVRIATAAAGKGAYHQISPHVGRWPACWGNLESFMAQQPFDSLQPPVRRRVPGVDTRGSARADGSESSDPRPLAVLHPTFCVDAGRVRWLVHVAPADR